MTHAIIHFCPVEKMMLMYGRDSTAAAETMTAMYKSGQMQSNIVIVPATLSGDYIADEVFDLTNNPSRQEERLKSYGNGRSLSVGDIVETDTGQLFLCCSSGWKELTV